MSFDNFKSSIDEAIEELTSQRRFIEAATKTPVLLFTTADKELKGSKSLIFTSVKRELHKFQEYLAELMNTYFQKQCTYDLTVKVRQPMSFPSIFAIYCGDIEIAQFNIYKQWYGIRDKPKLEDEINAENKRQREDKEKELKLVEEKIDKWEAVLKHPYKYVYDFYFVNRKLKWKSLFFFVQDLSRLSFSKGLFEKIDNRISKERDKLVEIEKRYARHSFDPKEFIRLNKERETLIKYCVDFFELHKYKLQEERHKLY
ncbi:hypothetical protein [Paenibacillus sophorae]|uniref:hypothetical protein n=1 Tax=Paenibacillus sophorae TaxID=1333845 RepID=UPI0004B16920|nr:hypothetical protein [Paenibacillus sophorae]